MGVFTELSLFSGTGGGLLATQHLLGWRTICYVEWGDYAIEVLKARIRDGYLNDAPIWDNAFTFDGRPWFGLVDVVTAGFPCQPFSTAGKGLAEHDPRNGWPAVIRIIREVRPRYALLENVPGLLAKPYFRRILGDLAEAGYFFKHDCITAAEVGAPHKRERLWIIADTNSPADGEQYFDAETWNHLYANHIDVSNTQGSQRNVPGEQRKAKMDLGRHGGTQQMADTNSWRQQGSQALEEIKDGWEWSDFIGEGFIHDSEHPWNGWRKSRTEEGQKERNIYHSQWWEAEPSVGRVVNGVAHRMDRLEATGNGQVPRVVVEAAVRHGIIG